MPDRPQSAPPSDPAKRHSAALTDGPDRAGARAMLKAIGFTDEDLAKPLVGVATTWIETMPCNYNQRRLAESVKEGIRAAGGTPMEFNTVSVSDGRFTIITEKSTCTLDAPVPPGGDCSVEMTVKPSAPNPVSAKVTVAEDGFQATAISARVSGAGGAPTDSLSRRLRVLRARSSARAVATAQDLRRCRGPRRR